MRFSVSMCPGHLYLCPLYMFMLFSFKSSSTMGFFFEFKKFIFLDMGEHHFQIYFFVFPPRLNQNDIGLVQFEPLTGANCQWLPLKKNTKKFKVKYKQQHKRGKEEGLTQQFLTTNYSNHKFMSYG